ncbi:MAG: hypothetical protein OEN50_02125 [Deltaproteobacteria bacterium]|nr:hypothetical protein [Deltaproteobacteria bacterium]
MNKVSPAVIIGVVSAFLGGFLSHFFYQRWKMPDAEQGAAGISRPVSRDESIEPQSHRVAFVPLAAPSATLVQSPVLQAREVEKIRSLTGSQARIRGRVFRVGHSVRSNTYFLNFGPSREALTAVIFSSAVEIFEKRMLKPNHYQGKEVEIEGVVKDHPQYGLEIILEDPAQIRIVN